MSILPERRADADVSKMGRSLMHPDAPATERQRGRHGQSAETGSGYFGMLTSTRAAHLFSRCALHDTKAKSIPDGKWKITKYIVYKIRSIPCGDWSLLVSPSLELPAANIQCIH
jgi:hypothetical protein